MHELSLATGILEMVETAAAREHFQRVAQLRLEAGALAGVDVHALQFALDAIKPGTCLAEAEIIIDQPPGMGWCALCTTTVEVASRSDPCPQCGAYPVQITGGTDLRVMDLVVHDASLANDDREKRACA
jgi:hydrogenase nickel incorporation protein HypA/HybF